MTQTKPIFPHELTGPRSYFTDLDRKDLNYSAVELIRKLKLQLLTKKSVVLSAASLFHDVGFNLFSTDTGLTKALNEGIILPAIQDEFNGISGFFDAKNPEEYMVKSLEYFSAHTRKFVPWNLYDNAHWFENAFLTNLTDSNSVLRKSLSISGQAALELKMELTEIVQAKPTGKRILSRDDIKIATTRISEADAKALNGFGHLVYRISGARVVNSEGHFPQSNLTTLNFAGNEQYLADPQIFWDIYIEAVTSRLNSAARLSVERLDNLTFEDVLKIRDELFDVKFVEHFDRLISIAKSEVNIYDPDKLLLAQEEINEITIQLETVMRKRIDQELGKLPYNVNTLFQVGSLIEPVTNSSILGTLGVLKTISEITVQHSPRLADAITSRTRAAKRLIDKNNRLNLKQRQALLHGYDRILKYGMPNLG